MTDITAILLLLSPNLTARWCRLFMEVTIMHTTIRPRGTVRRTFMELTLRALTAHQT